jgi:hypothetical protein
LPYCHFAILPRCWQSSSLELFLEPIVKLDDLLGGLSFRLELLRRLPGRQRVAKSGALLDATGATASPCTAAPARASARRRVAPGGMAFKTTKAGLPASFTISAVVPIARKSRIPGRHGMRIRSAAFAAASEALSACGAVSIRAPGRPHLPSRLGGLREPGKPHGYDNGGFSLTRVFPTGSACLRIEVDHDCGLSSFLGCDGKVKRGRGFPGSTLLALDSYGFHSTVLPHCCVASNVAARLAALLAIRQFWFSPMDFLICNSYLKTQLDGLCQPMSRVLVSGAPRAVIYVFADDHCPPHVHARHRGEGWIARVRISSSAPRSS